MASSLIGFPVIILGYRGYRENAGAAGANISKAAVAAGTDDLHIRDQRPVKHYAVMDFSERPLAHRLSALVDCLNCTGIAR
jgi:hypothetical protein